MTMMHYRKGRNIETELTKEDIPIDCLPANYLWMHVKGGTKVSNVIDYAKNAINSGEYRSVVWSGSGGGVVKTISCAEIMKRENVFHQVTKLGYRKCEEHWDPAQSGLEKIIVTRKIPCIHIFQSLDEIKINELGYQKPNVDTPLGILKSNDGSSNSNSSKPGTSNHQKFKEGYRNKRPREQNNQRRSNSSNNNNKKKNNSKRTNL